MMDTWWKLTKANKWTETPIELRMLLRRWMEQVRQRMRTAQPSGNTVQMCSFFVIVIKDLRKTVSGRKALCWLRVWGVPFHGDGKGVIEPSSSPHGSSETAIGCYIHRPPYPCILLGPQVAECTFRIGLYLSLYPFWNQPYRHTWFLNPFSLTRFMMAKLGEG